MQFLVGQNEKVARWVAKRMPMAVNGQFKNCSAIGVLDSKGNALCGVVYHNWDPEHKTIALSFAASSPRWAHPRIVQKLLAYPFEELKVEKIWTLSLSTNERVLKLAKGLGFIQEARLYRHFGKNDAIICRMLKKDYVRRYGVKRDARQDARSSHAA